jgi:hypothetical protein
VTNLTPGADFTITQNSVIPFKSVASGALVNTLVLSAGQVGIGMTPSGVSLDIGRATGGKAIRVSQLAENGTAANSFTAVDFVVPTSGLVAQLLATANNYASAGTVNIGPNSLGLFVESTAGQLTLAAAGANGVITFNTGGYGTANQRMSINNVGTAALMSATFFDQTATTGATLVTITPGASQTAASKVFEIAGNQKFGGTNSTAAVTGLIGTTCPAVTCTAAYTWVQAIAADNSVVYFPVWK